MEDKTLRGTEARSPTRSEEKTVQTTTETLFETNWDSSLEVVNLTLRQKVSQERKFYKRNYLSRNEKHRTLRVQPLSHEKHREN